MATKTLTVKSFFFSFTSKKGEEDYTYSKDLLLVKNQVLPFYSSLDTVKGDNGSVENFVKSVDFVLQTVDAICKRDKVSIPTSFTIIIMEDLKEEGKDLIRTRKTYKVKISHIKKVADNYRVPEDNITFTSEVLEGKKDKAARGKKAKGLDINAL